MLEVSNLDVIYGHVHAVRGVSFNVEAGETVGLIGANGAGKTSILKAITGLAPVSSGGISFRGKNLKGIPTEKIFRQGISFVPEGRMVFSRLTVEENLVLAAKTAGEKDGTAVKRIVERFPILGRYRSIPAGKLSGGEQQMLVIGRALLARPRILLLDEPSLGLAPLIVDEVFEIVAELRNDGATVLLVEQNASKTIAAADRTYVMENGSLHALSHDDHLDSKKELIAAYLGEEPVESHE